MLLKSLVSSISKVTQDLGNTISTQSALSSGGSLQLSLTLSATVNSVVNNITSTSSTIKTIIDGLTDNLHSTPLETVTDLLGGLTGGISTGDNPLSAITAPLQTGIDVLQGVESLKTDVINSAIDTLADAGISILPQAEHQISTLANLGTLTFETSRDTVNGTLDAVSAVVDLNPQGVSNALTGVVGTLVENGSTATHLLSGLSGGLEGNPLEVVTDLVGGLTGGANTNPLETVTDLLGGLTGNIDTGLLGNLTGSLHGLIDIGETLTVSGTEIVADTSHALLNAFEVAADSTANLVSSLLDGVTLTTETTNHQLGLVSDLLNNATSSLSNISHTYQTPISVPNVLDQLLENHLSSV